MHMRNIVVLGALLAALLPGCSSDLAAIAVGAGEMPVYQRPTYDVPAQVIYRIDDKRYFTIENYEDCSVGGDVYFHDERTSMKAKVWYLGAGIWPGKFRIEPNDTHLAFPTFGCGDKTCSLKIRYSTDGGKKWESFPSWTFGHYPKTEELKQTEVVVKGNHIYVRGPGQPWVSRYTFDSGMRWGEVKGGYEHLDPSQWPRVVTASKQDRFTCDTSVKPKNVSEAK